MALDAGQTVLEESIFLMLEDFATRPDRPEVARRDFAHLLAQNIVECIKTATVSVTVATTGSATAQTGTGTGTLN